MKSGTPIPTGTGPTRRRLTEAEAAAGGLPERFTRLEWATMALACAEYRPVDAFDDANARFLAAWEAEHGPRPLRLPNGWEFTPV